MRTRSRIRITTRKLVANTRSSKATQVVVLPEEAPEELMKNSGVAVT